MGIILDMEETSRRPKKRQKLCHNCEGDVDLDVIVCPFCAADLREEKPELKRLGGNAVQKMFQENQSVHSLYPSSTASSIPAPYQENDAPIHSETQKEEISSHRPYIRSGGFTAIWMFSMGVQLTLVGLLMFVFSRDGIVQLKWNAKWWFLYAAIGIPFLYFGFRSLSPMISDESNA